MRCTVTVKDIIKEKLQERVEWWSETEGTLPMTSWLEEIDQRLYVGTPDDNEYVQWNYMEKEQDDLSDVEDLFNIVFHEEIKAYYNGYWFLELTGFFGEYQILMHEVVPGAYKAQLITHLKEYKEVHNGEVEYLPIGLEANTGFSILINNTTGKVYLEDYEVDKLIEIAPNLMSLLENLEAKKG